MLCALDVVNSVAFTVRILVGHMRRKDLLEENASSVVTFDCHSDVGPSGYLSVERAILEKSDVDFNMRDLSREAFVRKVGKQSY